MLPAGPSAWPAHLRGSHIAMHAHVVGQSQPARPRRTLLHASDPALHLWPDPQWTPFCELVYSRPEARGQPARTERCIVYLVDGWSLASRNPEAADQLQVCGSGRHRLGTAAKVVPCG